MQCAAQIADVRMADVTVIEVAELVIAWRGTVLKVMTIYTKKEKNPIQNRILEENRKRP